MCKLFHSFNDHTRWGPFYLVWSSKHWDCICRDWLFLLWLLSDQKWFYIQEHCMQWMNYQLDLPGRKTPILNLLHISLHPLMVFPPCTPHTYLLFYSLKPLYVLQFWQIKPWKHSLFWLQLLQIKNHIKTKWVNIYLIFSSSKLEK